MLQEDLTLAPGPSCGISSAPAEPASTARRLHKPAPVAPVGAARSMQLKRTRDERTSEQAKQLFAAPESNGCAALRYSPPRPYDPQIQLNSAAKLTLGFQLHRVQGRRCEAPKTGLERFHAADAAAAQAQAARGGGPDGDGARHGQVG